MEHHRPRVTPATSHDGPSRGRLSGRRRTAPTDALPQPSGRPLDPGHQRRRQPRCGYRDAILRWHHRPDDGRGGHRWLFGAHSGSLCRCLLRAGADHLFLYAGERQRDAPHPRHHGGLPRLLADLAPELLRLGRSHPWLRHVGHGRFQFRLQYPPALLCALHLGRVDCRAAPCEAPERPAAWRTLRHELGR